MSDTKRAITFPAPVSAHKKLLLKQDSTFSVCRKTAKRPLTFGRTQHNM